MYNKLKDDTYYFFDNMINIKTLDPNKIKIEKKSCKNKNVKDIRYIKTNSLNPLDFIINGINRYIEESNWNKCLALAHTNESKHTLKQHEELWIKITDLTRSKTDNSGDFDKKYNKSRSKPNIKSHIYS